MTEKRNQSNPKPQQPAKQLWTRKKAAEYLGVSISKVRTLEGKELHPTKRKGVNYFEPEAVRSYASKMSKKPKAHAQSEGKIAALAFRLFNEGKDLRDVVCELEIPPKVACELYEAWQTPDLDHALRKAKHRAAAEAEAEAQAKHEASMKEFQAQMREQQKQSEKEFEAFLKRRAVQQAKEEAAAQAREAGREELLERLKKSYRR